MRWRALHLDFQDFNFVDIGSGKGRALLLASDYPFREIIGIELSPELDRVAQGEVAICEVIRPGRTVHRPPVTCIQGDAAEFFGHLVR